jgi:hypothetical protein
MWIFQQHPDYTSFLARVPMVFIPLRILSGVHSAPISDLPNLKSSDAATEGRHITALTS